MKPPKVLVIGCVSFDTLHLGNERTSHSTIGGAGLYTALAARSAGAEVTLYAPVPALLVTSLIQLRNMLTWTGPIVAEKDMPHLEIAHHGQGHATLLSAAWGAESQLTEEHLPQPDDFDAVHVAALSSAQRQLDFLKTCQSAKPTIFLSSGTYARSVYTEKDKVLALAEFCTVFFLNENEANGLFGSISKSVSSPGRKLFITEGERGATIVEQDSRTHVDVTAIDEVDPTGAGDSFCGSALVALLRGASAVEAAIEGSFWARKCISAVGPSAFFTKTS